MVDPSLIAHLAYSHDLIHWLGDLRHYLASCFNAQAVGGNTGAAVYWTVIASGFTYAFWPKFRDKINSWIGEHFHKHNKVQTEQFQSMLDQHKEDIKAHLDQHHEAMKEHVANAIAEANLTKDI